ncbi:MAG: phage protease [Deferrisomatales bacterium]|nr:phage protease [Deferrisomatales bacterium]
MHSQALSVPLELPARGQAPEWVELLPLGPTIKGRDGRQWLNDRPDEVVAAFSTANEPVLIDYEHASELAAPEGKPAPAAGWLSQLAVRGGGSVWGRVEWTPRAAQMISDREYRFLSPCFSYDRQTNRIVRLLSVGLTNRPNLALVALNRLLARGAGQAMVVNTANPAPAAMAGITPEDAAKIQHAFGHTPEDLQRWAPPSTEITTISEKDAATLRHLFGEDWRG